MRSREDRQHLREPGFTTLYVRKSKRRGIDIELASVTARKPGSGALTKLLDRLEPRYTVLFESVLSKRLVAYLERRGYTRWGYAESIDMARTKG